MADPQQLALLQQGADVWNQWRKQNEDLTPDLSEANLGGAKLGGGANLGGANVVWAYVHVNGTNLSWTNLSKGNLSKADLGGTDLRGADLREANLREIYLREANLSGADLRGANLSGANLDRADLGGANLHEARLYRTIFANTNLKDVRGLDACLHLGPSILDHQTLAKSGRLPLAFLRGCGLPDKLIDFLPSLLIEAIEFYSCFISYSTKDQEFAERLHADLQNKGVRCWFAPRDIQGGKKIHEQIDEAIRVYDRLLLILSPDSMSSEWVKTEIAKARKRENRDKARILFPIRLVPFATMRNWECFDADTGKDSAREIREYFIPDFSNWKDHDRYQKAFNRLLGDLKATDKGPVA